jgi:ArsR family transcriptional regulator
VVPPTELAPGRRDRLVAVYRALGDPTRLDVFRLIAAQAAPLCVCDIVDRFNVSQPTISHHLRVLRDAGLVTVSRRGVWAYYALDPAGLALLHGAPAELVPGQFADVS